MADGVTIPATGSGSATPVVSTDDCGAAGHAQIVKLAISTDGSATPIPADAANGIDVDVTRVTGTVTVDGSGVTQPVSGTFWQATQPVSAASLPLPTGASTAAKQPALGVAGTASADVLTMQGIAGMTAVKVDNSAVTQPISAASLPLPTDASTETTLAALNAKVTAVNTGAVTISAAPTGSSAIQVQGAGATGVAPVGSPVSVGGWDGTNTQRLRVWSTGQISVASAGSTPADATGNNSKEMLDGSGNTAPMRVLPMVFNGATWDRIRGSTTGLSAIGGLAADAANTAANNPQVIGAQAETSADAAPGTRVSADVDVVQIAADRDGALYTHPHGPQIWQYHENSSNALTDQEVHAAPAAGLSLYVTDIVVSTGAATALNVFFEESATTVLGPYYLEAVAGRGFALHFTTPHKCTAATALTVTTSAAIAHSMDVHGYIAP